MLIIATDGLLSTAVIYTCCVHVQCIGRIAWNTLLVRDCRNITDPDEIMAECLEHQRLATADGSLKAVMTVFRYYTQCTCSITSLA